MPPQTNPADYLLDLTSRISTGGAGSKGRDIPHSQAKAGRRTPEFSAPYIVW